MKPISPFMVPISIVGIVMFMPVLAILVHSIPGTALLAAVVIIVLAYQVRKAYEARLRHSVEASTGEVTALRRKVAEMEDRLSTLQEIVISDYDTKRAIGRIEAASEHVRPATDSPVQPRQEVRVADR